MQIRYILNPRSHSTLHPTQTNCASNLHTGMHLANGLLQQRPLTFSLSARAHWLIRAPRHPQSGTASGRTRPWKTRERARSRDLFHPPSGGGGSIRWASSPANPRSTWAGFSVSRCWVNGRRVTRFSATLEGVSTCTPWAARFFADSSGERTEELADGRAGGAPSLLRGSLAPQLWSRSTQLASSARPRPMHGPLAAAPLHQRTENAGDGFIALIYVPVGPTCRYRRKTRTHFCSLPFW